MGRFLSSSHCTSTSTSTLLRLGGTRAKQQASHAGFRQADQARPSRAGNKGGEKVSGTELWCARCASCNRTDSHHRNYYCFLTKYPCLSSSAARARASPKLVKSRLFLFTSSLNSVDKERANAHTAAPSTPHFHPFHSPTENTPRSPKSALPFLEPEHSRDNVHDIPSKIISSRHQHRHTHTPHTLHSLSHTTSPLLIHNYITLFKSREGDSALRIASTASLRSLLVVPNRHTYIPRPPPQFILVCPLM